MSVLNRSSRHFMTAALMLGIGGCSVQSWVSGAETPSKHSSQVGLTGVTILPSHSIGTVSPHFIGMNLHVTQDATRPGTIEMLRRTNARIVRWPGGSQSDYYQWRTNHLGLGWQAHPNSTFSRFMEKLVTPAQVNAAITLNYGSSASGKEGGDPKEAAAWVAEAKARGNRVAYWTVGNEVFGAWETDFNKRPHDAATYARRVSEEFYPRIKAANPRAQVGVVVNQYDLNNPIGWTLPVLRQAKYDFVEIHYYPQSPTSASDEFLLHGAVDQFRSQVTALQRAMGNRRVPILLGEFNNVPNLPNKQTLSVVNALYHGLIYAESAKLGLAAAFPWETVEDYCSYAPESGLKPTGNFSSALYGWQSFATYSMFSLGFPNNSKNCGRGIPPILYGTAFPTAHAAKLFGEFAAPNATLLETVLDPQYSSIRAFSASSRQGYRLLLFNLDRDRDITLPVTLQGNPGRWRTQQLTYGKAEYDQSRKNRWALPSEKSIGIAGNKLQVTLPPWSMSVVSLDR